MPVVTDAKARGNAIQNRAAALGIGSVKALSARTGISRDAVKKAFEGLASAGTYERLEAWLANEEADVAAPPAVPLPRGEEATIEFEVSGPGIPWHFVVRGPVELANETRRQAAELARELGLGD